MLRRHDYIIRLHTRDLEFCKYAVKSDRGAWEYREDGNGAYILEINVYTRHFPIPKFLGQKIGRFFEWSLELGYQRYLKERFNWKDESTNNG